MINKIILIGNVGNINQHGVVTKISLATSETYKDKAGQQVKDTQWHNVTLFGKLAEIANQYISKGSKLFVEGKVKYEKYTGKDGVEKTSTAIIASNIQMLDSKNNADASAHSSFEPKSYPAAKKYDGNIEDDLEDLPF